ncbi:unnamed protein product [Adineta ricciae]|uniref:PHD-type domain-containing protein n=2 Tax=Adineta ricciae TaxID=249248 RepID=A0A814VEJ0_ADIRI|nr:unnamed protein product [Adineta ricciae]
MYRSQISSTTRDERIIIEFDDTIRAWNDWKHGNTNKKSSISERYVISLVECTEMYMMHTPSLNDHSMPFEPISVPSMVHTLPEISQLCHLCHKYQGQLYPCRICGKVYHQQCIKDMGNIKSYHSIKNALNLIGWSCPTCEDLRVLLSTAESTETNAWIQSLGPQTVFNLDTYIQTRLKPNRTKHMKDILQTYVNTIADISTNRLTQTDLLLLDVSLKIVRTPPKLLVNSLSTFELYRISQLFLAFSSPDKQSITYDKFQQILNMYLMTTVAELKPDERQSHISALGYNLFGNIMKYDQTWNQFVLDATIPTLLGRYNHRTPDSFINRIVSIRRSIASSTNVSKEYDSRESLEMFMNRVFQNLSQATGNENIPTNDYHRSTNVKTKTNTKLQY